eukprot:s77_g11.t2
MSGVLSESGLRIREIAEKHEFRFGNAGVLHTTKTALIPISLAGNALAIRAAVLPGSGAQTPLLLSKELLRSLKAKIDMERDCLVIGRYGVTIPLKETERGHYALPLFDFKKRMQQNVQAETHEDLSIMNYATNEADTPMVSELVQRTPLVERLLSDLTPQLQGTSEENLGSAILDNCSDHEEDEPEGLVSGLSGAMVFNVGKYEKMKVAMTFAQCYVQDKKYVAWVRKFIKGKDSKNGKNESHPTMAMFRLYIELRDQLKSRRVKQQSSTASPTASTWQEQRPVVPRVQVMQSRPKAKAKAPPVVPCLPVTPSVQTSAVADDGEWSMASASMEVPDVMKQRRAMLRQRIEALNAELEELEEQLTL